MSHNTMYNPIVNVENEGLRERLKEYQAGMKDILAIIGNPVAGCYLTLGEVETIKSIITRLSR